MNFRLSEFSSVIDEIRSHEDKNFDIAPHLLKRIERLLPDSDAERQRLYEVAGDACIAFHPLYYGIPREEVSKEDLELEKKSIPEAFLPHIDELSGADWFNAGPATWFAVVAAYLLGNGLFLARFIKQGLSDQDTAESREMQQHLPTHIVTHYGLCAEALIVAGVMEHQHIVASKLREQTARKGGLERNRKYAEARDGFIEFYVRHTDLSRAEAARRFFRQIEAVRNPRDPSLYRSEESAVRAFTDALRRAGI